MLLLLVSMARANLLSELNDDERKMSLSMLGFGMRYWWQHLLPNVEGQWIDETDAAILDDRALLAHRIKTHIIGNTEIREKFTKIILQLCDESKEFAANLQLLLDYYPAFRIMPRRGQDFQNLGEFGHVKGSVKPIPLLVSLSSDAQDLEELPGIIRHELDHLFRFFVSEKLADSPYQQLTTRIYFPKSLNLEKAYVDALTKAENRFYDLIALQQKINRKQKISKKQEKRIGDFKKFARSLEKLKKWRMRISLPHKAIDDLKRKGIHFATGKKYNIDKDITSPTLVGDFTVTDIVSNQEEVKLTIKCDDPIMNLYAGYFEIKARLESFYNDEDFMNELLAYLRQYFPEKILKTFYKELYELDEVLREKLLAEIAEQPQEFCAAIDDHCRYSQLVARHSQIMEFTQEPNATIQLQHAEFLLKAGDYQTAQILLLKLDANSNLERGVKTATERYLGIIAFAMNDYETSFQRFTNALTLNPSSLRAIEFLMLAKILEQDGHSEQIKILLQDKCDPMSQDASVEDEIVDLCRRMLKQA